MKVRALSIIQPWAELIISGKKYWETRNYSYLPKAVAGEPLVIHASKSRGHLPTFYKFAIAPGAVTYGALIGIVRVEIVRWLNDCDRVNALCDCDGCAGIGCADPVRFPKAIPQKGNRGFFFVDIPDAVLGACWGGFQTRPYTASVVK